LFSIDLPVGYGVGNPVQSIILIYVIIITILITTENNNNISASFSQVGIVFAVGATVPNAGALLSSHSLLVVYDWF